MFLHKKQQFQELFGTQRRAIYFKDEIVIEIYKIIFGEWKFFRPFDSKFKIYFV